MREGDFVFYGHSVACGKKQIDEHFMLACSRGAYQNILLRKSGGALIGVGALKGMNTVDIHKINKPKNFQIQISTSPQGLRESWNLSDKKLTTSRTSSH